MFSNHGRQNRCRRAAEAEARAARKADSGGQARAAAEQARPVNYAPAPRWDAEQASPSELRKPPHGGYPGAPWGVR